MYIVIFCSLIALFLTFKESTRRLKNGMKWGFILITFLGCIHYNYGNDYMSNYSLYSVIEATPFNLHKILEGDIYREPGWAILMYGFKYFGGFFTMVAVLNVIQNLIVYKFIKNEIPQDWWTLAVFTYLFQTSYYLINFSMMRQGFIVCVFLGLWPFIRDRKWWIPLIILICCSFIHGSSLILVPFAFWGFLPNIRGKYFAIFYICLITILWMNQSIVDNLLSKFFAFDEFDNYTRYQEDRGTFSFGLGAIIQLLPFFVALYYFFSSKKNPVSEKQLVAIATLAFAITPFTRIVPAAGRLGIYFGILGLAAMTITYRSISNNGIKIFVLFLYIIITLYDYIIFFSDPSFIQHYSKFHTIFEVI